MTHVNKYLMHELAIGELALEKHIAYYNLLLIF
jgi:hypothetical protein